MTGLGPLLVAGYLAMQYWDTTKRYNDKYVEPGTKTLPPAFANDGDALMTKDARVSYGSGWGITNKFAVKPNVHKDWARFDVDASTGPDWISQQQSLARKSAMDDIYPMTLQQAYANMPPGTHLADWKGSLRFSYFEPERGMPDHMSFQTPELQQRFQELRAQYGRADTRME